MGNFESIDRLVTPLSCWHPAFSALKVLLECRITNQTVSHNEFDWRKCMIRPIKFNNNCAASMDVVLE